MVRSDCDEHAGAVAGGNVGTANWRFHQTSLSRTFRGDGPNPEPPRARSITTAFGLACIFVALVDGGTAVISGRLKAVAIRGRGCTLGAVFMNAEGRIRLIGLGSCL